MPQNSLTFDIFRNFLNFMVLGSIYQHRFHNRHDWSSLTTLFYDTEISEYLKDLLKKDAAGRFYHNIEELKKGLKGCLDFRPSISKSRIPRTLVDDQIQYQSLRPSDLDELFFYHYAIDYSPCSQLQPRVGRLIYPFLPYLRGIRLTNIPNYDDANINTVSFDIHNNFEQKSVALVCHFSKKSKLISVELRTKSEKVCIDFRNEELSLYDPIGSSERKVHLKNFDELLAIVGSPL